MRGTLFTNELAVPADCGTTIEERPRVTAGTVNVCITNYTLTEHATLGLIRSLHRAADTLHTGAYTQKRFVAAIKKSLP